MALFDSAADGLLTGIVSTSGAILLTVLRERFKKRSYTDAWQAQAKELLRASSRANDSDREWYRTEISRRDELYRRDLDGKDVALAHCQGEVQRLNRLLTKERRDD